MHPQPHELSLPGGRTVPPSGNVLSTPLATRSAHGRTQHTRVPSYPRLPTDTDWDQPLAKEGRPVGASDHREVIPWTHQTVVVTQPPG